MRFGNTQIWNLKKVVTANSNDESYAWLTNFWFIIGFIDHITVELSERCMLGNWEIVVMDQKVSAKYRIK